MVMELAAMIAVIVFLVIQSMMFGGDTFIVLLDFPSLLCILFLSLPILMRKGMWRDFVRSFKMWKKNSTFSLGELKRTKEAVEFMQRQILCAGIITSLFPFIYVLKAVSDLASLGPCIFVALISAMYTAILQMLLLPLQLEVRSRIIHYMEEES